MIKASLTFHDPIEIYDYFKKDYGRFQMLIKGNTAFLRFQNPYSADQILAKDKIIIKGYQLKVKTFGEDQSKKNAQIPLDSSTGLQNTKMDLEDQRDGAQEAPLLNDLIQSLKLKTKHKQIGDEYEKKLQRIKETVLDESECSKKINQFSIFTRNYIARNKKDFLKPYTAFISEMKQYSGSNINNIVDLDQKFQSQTFANVNKSQRNLITGIFSEGLNYNNFDVVQAKKLCLLNQQDFVSTVKIRCQGPLNNSGQLRIYRKSQIPPKFNIGIEEGPYSLMVYENFILVGDFAGYISFIDIDNENRCEYSNRLNPGLIVQMQNFSKKSTESKFSSMITLLSGLRNDFKIKLFQIQKEKINEDINSLTFHPKQQIPCEGITMGLQVIQDEKFAYCCGRNTWIRSSFDRKQSEYIVHDQNVMKIKRRNNNQLIQATQSKIDLADLRTAHVKNEVYDFNHDINNLQLLSQVYLIYGGQKGELGTIDLRKTNQIIWVPSQQLHKGKISDILKIGNDVITCDKNGIICEWKAEDWK